MFITSEQRDDVTVVAVAGNLDTMTSPRLSEALNERLGAQAHRLVLDLAQVAYISSAGVRALLAAVKGARGQGGDLRLASVQDTVMRVLEMSGLDSIFERHATVDEAVGSFAA